MRKLAQLLKDERASSAAEFALVLPLLLIFLLGIVDVGRLMWTWNQAEKATQMGVRYAVVTTPVSSGLQSYNFVTNGGVLPGEVVPASVFGSITCTSADCNACTGSACTQNGFKATDSTAFSALVNYMKYFYPGIADNAKVKVTYANSGLGYAGDPNSLAVAPIVTVSLQNVTFTPTAFVLFKQAITLPPFQSSLTFEDGPGSQSN